MRATLILALVAACTGGDGETKTVTNTNTNTITNTNTNTNTITLDGEVDCDGDLCILSGTLTEDLTLTADKEWLLRGGVFIGDDVNPTVLTIEPGTRIYGESSTDGMLVVRRSSQIIARGTAALPIIFSSSKLDGERARGDWGGVIINGRSTINSCAGGTGVCEAFGEGGTGFYGGDDEADNSGVLEYVRVEFAGTLISPDNELNGIAFQGVGSGTTVDHIQVHMNADDGVEFFGGTVNVKHVLVTGVGDDSMDWTDGWRGRAQHIVLQQYDDGGDQGIEADNNAEANDATPRSKPILSNVTVIGSPDSTFSDLGLLLREGTGAEIHNALVMGFNEACLDVEHDETWSIAGTDLIMANSVIDCATPFKEVEGEAGVVGDWFAAVASNEQGDTMIADPFNVTAPDFSSTRTGAVIPSDPWFDDVDHKGGVGADDWTAGWTISARN
jgi:hypothetical protein